MNKVLMVLTMSMSAAFAQPPVHDGAIPGAYRVRGNIQGVRAPIGGWWLKSLVVGGRDILDAPLDLRASADDGVATFSDRASELSGAVTTAQSSPSPDAYVVAFSTDRSTWFMNSRRVAGVRVDRDGRYTIRNLPPGEYRVAATTDIDQGEWFDPAVLDRLLAVGVPVTVAGAEKITVNIQ
ncbi:MAG TPA: carboxypeptidase-like regulatory domain-containing protein [Vicinamibacterales bacterium]|nr:carboxypeptidase-like regulatory domain-containing protein [Vicinamibacterales bacterium]